MNSMGHFQRREEPPRAGGEMKRAAHLHRSLATLAMTCMIVLATACRSGAPASAGPATPASAAPAAPASAAPATPAEAGAPSLKEVPAAALQDVAGESTDAAVAVPADAPDGGFDFENEWIYSRYGRFRRRGGGTGSLNGRRYDVVDIELPNGDRKKVYFDITENWAKWTPPGP